VVLKSLRSERRRLADEVYDQLMSAIRTGDIGADDRLVQEKLAAEMEISRTPVREALMRLEQEGVLMTSPRGGFVLYQISEGEIREIYQARAAIESHAARYLAKAPDPVKVADLRTTIEREERISSRTVQSYFSANRNIHRRFVELIDNRYMLEMFDNIWNRGIAFRLFAAIEKLDLAQSLGDHMELVDAIETGDPIRALEASLAHVEQGFDLQMAALAAD